MKANPENRMHEAAKIKPSNKWARADLGVRDDGGEPTVTGAVMQQPLETAGGAGEHSSGDLFVAFATGNRDLATGDGTTGRPGDHRYGDGDHRVDAGREAGEHPEPEEGGQGQ